MRIRTLLALLLALSLCLCLAACASREREDADEETTEESAPPRDADMVEIPDFTGKSYTDVVNDADDRFNFSVVFISDPTAEDGTILEQSPTPGSRVKPGEDGVKVTLKVSAGAVLTEIPDVIGWDSQEATDKLKNAGFQVQQELEQSTTVTKDSVIRTEPEPGQSVESGSIVKLIISGGTELRTVAMPDLSSLSEAAAIARIEGNGLTLGAVYREANDAPAGTVYQQSVVPGTDIAQNSKIYIWVSTGPAANQGNR